MPSALSGTSRMRVTPHSSALATLGPTTRSAAIAAEVLRLVERVVVQGRQAASIGCGGRSLVVRTPSSYLSSFLPSFSLSHSMATS